MNAQKHAKTEETGTPIIMVCYEIFSPILNSCKRTRVQSLKIHRLFVDGADYV